MFSRHKHQRKLQLARRRPPPKERLQLGASLTQARTQPGMRLLLGIVVSRRAYLDGGAFKGGVSSDPKRPEMSSNCRTRLSQNSSHWFIYGSKKGMKLGQKCD